ncbi:MAG TPA: enoyl-CoA hydratase-related protein [Acidimicrobiales bacterium]|nr:enoyl-CoA hydratase-related protein [Acidimicrobiales bacterium]
MKVAVDVAAREGIALVELNDPAKYNALTSGMVRELTETFATLRVDRSVRVVVLAGRGKGFCAGANMSGSDEIPEFARDRGPVGFIQVLQEQLADLVLAIHELPQPVIAAVHGAAVGGGLALALACDLRIASDDAYFAAHFIRVGLSSCDVGTSYTLPRIVSPTIAAELMLTGRRFAADEASRIGLLNRVVPRDQLHGAAFELGEGITANSEFGVYMTKLGLWANLDAPSLRHAIQLENRTQVLGTFTGNMREAAQAFVEKRRPVWKQM